MCGRSKFLGRACGVVWEEARSKDEGSCGTLNERSRGVAVLLIWHTCAKYHNPFSNDKFVMVRYNF